MQFLPLFYFNFLLEKISTYTETEDSSESDCPWVHASLGALAAPIYRNMLHANLQS